jgi:DNA helicase II / ATP-dependent DNA helicase PcrA
MLNLGSLNPQQRLAVETLHGPLLILAGAGTGKTRVITFRIAYMMEQGIAPGKILGVTFTNKAAREMQERVRQLVPRTRNAERGTPSAATATANSEFRTPNSEPPDRPTLCTFHSLCVRILRQHIEKLGYKRNFVIYNESEQLGVIKRILSHLSANGEKTEPAAILAQLSRQRNGGSPPARFADASVAAIARHIRPRYESALRACNAVDFDDLILLVLRLFRDHPEALAACRAKYRYLMVDEYQDTNAAQFALVQALTKEHRNLCVVGDDDQSIYGWRGAEIANLLEMEKEFPDVKVIKLEQNYRSTNTILAAANALIKNNARRRGKQLWSAKGQGARITLHTFPNEDEEARTMVEEIEFLRQVKRVPWSRQAILFRTNLQSRPLETALRKGGVRYHLVGGQSFFDRREVKDFLAYLKVFLNPDDDVSLLRIANVPARGMSDVTMERLLSASQERKCSVFGAMNNPAVQATFLSRTRGSIETFVAFVERTRDRLTTLGTPCDSIPARESGNESKETLHGARAPHWDQEPRDRSADLRSGASANETGFAPGRRPALRPMERLREPAPNPSQEGSSTGGALSLSGETRFVPVPLLGGARGGPAGGKSTDGEKLCLHTWAQDFLAEIGYADELRRSEKDPETAESRVRNLQDLVASLNEDGRESLPPIERLLCFLEELALDSDREEEKENGGDAVTLITMHSCKGLEFPHVYIVGMEDGLLPHSRSKEEGTLDEERRLFYVAITRAMETLTLSHCGGRKKYGQLTPCQPSPFLKELPPELVEHADAKSKEPVTVESGKDLFTAMRSLLQ